MGQETRKYRKIMRTPQTGETQVRSSGMLLPCATVR